MVDVLFLLLIFFMTASIFGEAETQIDIELPSAETAEPGPQKSTQIVVTIDKDGRIFLSEKQRQIEELLPLFTELAAQFPGESVVVRGDKEASFGLAVQVMDLAQQAGIIDVSVKTVKPAIDL